MRACVRAGPGDWAEGCGVLGALHPRPLQTRPRSLSVPALAGELVTAELPGKLNVIAGVSKCGRGRQKRDALGERLHHLPKMEGSLEPRNARDSWNLEKAREQVLS